MVLTSLITCSVILTICLLIFINALPGSCCCIIVYTFLLSMISCIMIIISSLVMCFIIIIALVITLTIVEGSFLTLFLEAVACFCCGQIPYLPIDFMRDWKFMLVISLFSDRINFLTTSYINICKSFVERFK